MDVKNVLNITTPSIRYAAPPYINIGNNLMLRLCQRLRVIIVAQNKSKNDPATKINAASFMPILSLDVVTPKKGVANR